MTDAGIVACYGNVANARLIPAGEHAFYIAGDFSPGESTIVIRLPGEADRAALAKS